MLQRLRRMAHLQACSDWRCERSCLGTLFLEVTAHMVQRLLSKATPPAVVLPALLHGPLSLATEELEPAPCNEAAGFPQHGEVALRHASGRHRAISSSTSATSSGGAERLIVNDYGRRDPMQKKGLLCGCQHAS